MNDITLTNGGPATPVVINPPDQSGQLLDTIAQLALNPNLPIERLQALIDMRERVDAAQARKAFDQAIAAAKHELPEIVKNRRVHFKGKDGKPDTDYRHEDMAGIARQVDPILGRHGLSYRYRTEQVGEGGRILVTCILAHRDGHSEETSLAASPDSSGSKNNFQAIGSAVTYLQRYTLKAALGLASAHDDDGRAADDRGDPQPEMLTPEQKHRIFSLIEQIEALGDTTILQTVLTVAKVDSVDDMNVDKAASAIRKLEAGLEKRRANAGGAA